GKKLGSAAMFADLQQDMLAGADTAVFLHGYNVSWTAAVGTALALQLGLNRAPRPAGSPGVRGGLFSWPSDGAVIPWWSYRSDRSDARGSGAAVGRAFLKLRDWLVALRDRVARKEDQLCEQDIHLVCHSMGNYVLQFALERLADHTP